MLFFLPRPRDGVARSARRYQVSAVRCPRSPARRGFTLIELLTVVAIIALLIALLLPALQRAKRQGWKAYCYNNLRQIGTAFKAYAGDNDGKIPHVGTTYCRLYGTRGETWYHWLGKTGYLGKTEVYKGPLRGITGTRWAVLRCPAEQVMPRPAGQYNAVPYFDNEMVCSSYVMNWSVSWYQYYGGPQEPGACHYCACGSGGIFYGPQPDTLCCVPYPFRRGFAHLPDNSRMEDAAFVVDCDANSGGWRLPHFNYWIDRADGYPAGYTAYSSGWYYAFRHLSQANVLYMDGHVNSRFHAGQTSGTEWRYPPIYRVLWSHDPYIGG